MAGNAVLGICAGMVEVDFIPAGDHMTGIAGVPKLPVMRLVSSMAGNTSRVQPCISGILVTFQAFQAVMPTDQQKAGRAVIKSSIFPIRRVMAISALCPHFS